jgi:hypothetical protein
MAKYAVQLEVNVVRMPDDPKELKPGEDPLSALAAPMLKFIGAGPGLAGPPPGIQLRKAFQVEAISFAQLCLMLGRFDELAEQVECEHP